MKEGGRWEHSWPGLDPFPRGVGRGWQHAGKRLRPHGNGTSCEEMGWEAPGSGGDTAVPAGPAAVSTGLGALGSPRAEQGVLGVWGDTTAPGLGHPQIQGKQSMSPLGVSQAMALWREVTRAGPVPVVLGLGKAGSSARPPGRALGGSVRDSPALGGGGDPPEGYRPLIPGVALQGWLHVPLGNRRNSGNFHPCLSWL